MVIAKGVFAQMALVKNGKSNAKNPVISFLPLAVH
jgi:hypothetical protein